MSLYNMLCGVNSVAPILKSVLKLDEGPEPKYPTGRFRDIYLNEKGTGIILYTRNGGGNREDYQYVFDALSEHPNYIEDYDDDFDCTYAYVTFSVPQEAVELCKSLATGENPKTVGDRFQETIGAMEKMSKKRRKK